MHAKYLYSLLLLLIFVLIAAYSCNMKETPITPEIPSQNLTQKGSYVIEDVQEEVIEQVDKEQIIESAEVPKQAVVKITRTIFSPKVLRISKQTRVTWVNDDSSVHQIKELSADHYFRSERINPGESYSVLFEKSGEFDYIDAINTYMRGTVVVEDAAFTQITGNFVRSGQIQSDVVSLLLLIGLGITIIYFVHPQK